MPKYRVTETRTIEFEINKTVLRRFGSSFELANAAAYSQQLTTWEATNTEVEKLDD